MLTLFLALLFLFLTSVVAGTTTALLRMGRLEGEEEFKKNRNVFFFERFLNSLYGGKKWEAVLFSLSFIKQILRLCYGMSAFFFLLGTDPFRQVFTSFPPTEGSLNIFWILAIAGITIAISLLADFLMNLLAVINSKNYFVAFAPISSTLLTLTLPLTAPLFRLLVIFLPSLSKRKSISALRLRNKILEILQESELSYHLDLNDQKLILSVVSFKDRVAREVMVPRIDIFSLPADTTIQEAAQSFLSEGYSRIPVYQNSVDHIIGVLLYKDVLKIYAQASESKEKKDELQLPIEKCVKSVLYTPETKKISHLLQEFRSKKIHMAIVVDEYGGTEGIVTIEDILEELVGEIADEYDIGEEVLYTPETTGGWIVDSWMTIIDIEEDLGIKIPHSPEYDTIGGYIYHKAGAIPSPGWRLHHEDFDLEILSSDERSIDKIRITPHRES